MLGGAYTIYISAVTPNCNLQPLIKATLGTFYRTVDKPLEAIDMLKECIQKAGEKINLLFYKMVSRTLEY
jgi:hypothetical protein